jgi:hypothetical protein
MVVLKAKSADMDGFLIEIQRSQLIFMSTSMEKMNQTRLLVVRPVFLFQGSPYPDNTTEFKNNLSSGFKIRSVSGFTFINFTNIMPSGIESKNITTNIATTPRISVFINQVYRL